MHTSREKEVSISRLHPTLEQGLYLSSPVPTLPCQLKDFALLPVQFVDTDVNYGFLLFCLVRYVLNGASDHWKQRKVLRMNYSKMLWKTLVQTQACASRGTDFTTAAQVLVLCYFESLDYPVTSSIYLLFFIVYICNLSSKGQPHIKFKQKNNYIRKIALIMKKNSNKKIYAKCSLTTYFLFFSHYRHS